MDGEAGGFIEHQQFSVFEENIDLPRFGSRAFGLPGLGLERDEKLDAVSRSNQVVRLGAFAVQTYGVFTEQLAHVADGKIFREKILDFLAGLTLWNDDLLHYP